MDYAKYIHDQEQNEILEEIIQDLSVYEIKKIKKGNPVFINSILQAYTYKGIDGVRELI